MGRVESNAVICFHEKQKWMFSYINRFFIKEVRLDFLLIDQQHAADRLADMFYLFFFVRRLIVTRINIILFYFFK